jgi:eukaryotic-like serine/threonine-protein kinase
VFNSNGSGLHESRNWFLVFSVSTIYLVLSLNLAAQTSRADWPEYHHDNSRLGVNSNDYFINAANATHLALAWKFNSGAEMVTSPAVANGVVYTSNYGGYFYALNIRDGSLLWSYAYGLPHYSDSSPAVANGVVYIGADDEYMYALNAQTGALVWRYKTDGGIGCAPAVANGVVYFGSNDHNLYAVNASTGALIWQYTTGGITSAAPVVVGGVVYAG